MRILNSSFKSSIESSGRSITTDAQVVKEYEDNIQTLGLFHFNDNVINSASFYTSFSDSFRQSENSVNSLFGQSGIFNQRKSLQYDNSSIFNNNQGTIGTVTLLNANRRVAKS